MVVLVLQDLLAHIASEATATIYSHCSYLPLSTPTPTLILPLPLYPGLTLTLSQVCGGPVVPYFDLDGHPISIDFSAPFKRLSITTALEAYTLHCHCIVCY